MNPHSPIPENEMERLISLSALDFNYADPDNSLEDLTRLAAGIAGTPISLINLLDNYTQWSIARHGIELEQMPRDNTICQYTIMEEQQLEVKDLSQDERFKEKDYVAGNLNLKYYFGIPLKTDEGQHIGALCVLDKKVNALSPEKVDLLKIVAKEVVVRLKTKKATEDLNRQMAKMTETQNKLAHDIRGPISGIIGVARLFGHRRYDGDSKDKLKDVFSMIQESGESLLDLAEDIMNRSKKEGTYKNTGKGDQYNLSNFKETIEKLYLPMAKNKQLHFNVGLDPTNWHIFFNKNKLIEIAGNLVSNAIKFTPEGGTVAITLSLEHAHPDNMLRIAVKDSGIGIAPEIINRILNGSHASTDGTEGEHGYGLGLCMVRQLVNSMSGTFKISSVLGEGTEFNIQLPQKNNDAAVMISKAGVNREHAYH